MQVILFGIPLEIAWAVTVSWEADEITCRIVVFLKYGQSHLENLDPNVKVTYALNYILSVQDFRLLSLQLHSYRHFAGQVRLQFCVSLQMKRFILVMSA